MRNCAVCKKRINKENGPFFCVPKCEIRRQKWSVICGTAFTPNSRVCIDHFPRSQVITAGRRSILMPYAEPVMQNQQNEDFSGLPDAYEPLINSEARTSLGQPFQQYPEVAELPMEMENTNVGIFQEQQTKADSNPIFKHKMTTIISPERDTTSDKCRCCTNPSVNLIKLETSIKTSEGLEKTYKDLLNEITNFQIPVYQEHVMPQQICHKCSQQLKSSYKFFQQACQVSRQYLQMAYEQPTSPVDVKNIEHLEESLIEINESVYDSKLEAKIEVEPLIIEEFNAEIKQEIEDNELLIEGNPPKEEYAEDSSSENPNPTFPLEDDEHDDSEEPESLNGNEDFLANEPLARRCDICQKVYRNKKFLNNHIRYTHMPEEDKMPCPLCSYRANRSWSLRIHVGLAHGQDKVLEYFKPVPKSKKIHPCSYCSRSYAHKETLRQHIKTKHLNKPSIEEDLSETKPAKPKKSFLCTYCGQAFNWKHGLESHILTHTDERPFSCDICSKTFKRHKDLQLHRVIHSDEKPYQCTECGKAFKRVDKLKTHIKIVHSDLRPYKCSECEQSFKYQNVLRVHMNIHTGHSLTKPVGKHFRREHQ